MGNPPGNTLLARASEAISRADRAQARLLRDIDQAILELDDAGPLEAFDCLRRYRARVGALLGGLQRAQGKGMSPHWQAFVGAYADYLEALRQARCELVQAHRLHTFETRLPPAAS